MSREIEFRAWDRLCKRYWYEGFSVSFGGEVTHLSRQIQDARIKAGWTLVKSYDSTITGFDLGQYINRKDKSGVKIYEGDRWQSPSGNTYIVVMGEPRDYESGEVIGHEEAKP